MMLWCSSVLYCITLIHISIILRISIERLSQKGASTFLRYPSIIDQWGGTR